MNKLTVAEAEVIMKFSKTVCPRFGSRSKLTDVVVSERETLRNEIVNLNSRYRNNNQVIAGLK